MIPVDKLKDAKSLVAIVAAAVLVALGKLDADAFVFLVAGAQLLGKPLAEAKALIGK